METHWSDSRRRWAGRLCGGLRGGTAAEVVGVVVVSIRAQPPNGLKEKK